jgi:hypothetical protein
MNFKASQIQAIGIKVTTIGKLDEVGLGYVLPDDCIKDKAALEGIAWQSGGNGFYYPHEFKKIVRDNGTGYMDRVRGLMLPPAYRG